MDDTNNTQDISPFDFDHEIEKATTPKEIGALDYVADAAMGVPRGIESAGRDAYNLADDATAWVGQKITGDKNFDFLPDYKENFLGKSKTTAGQVVEGLTEFATLFIPGEGAISAAAKGAGTLSRVAKLGKVEKIVQGAAKVASFGGLGAGAIADVAMTSNETQTLSNLAKDMGFDNALTNYLAIDKTDSKGEKRLKAAVEGAFVGLGVEGALRAASPWLKAIKRVRAKNIALAGKLSDEDLSKVLTEHAFTKEDSDAIQTFQKSLKDTEESAAKMRAEDPTLDETINVLEDTGHLINGGDVHAIAKQNFKNVVDVNRKLESHWMQIQASDKMSREDFNQLLDHVVKLNEVTSLQGKSLAALKGQAGIRDAALDSAKVKALKESVAKMKGMSDLEIQSYKDILGTLSSPSEVRKFLSQNLSTVPPSFAKKLGEVTQETWKGMLLSNPATHILNTLGNTFTLLHQPLSRGLSAVFKGDTRAIGSAIQELKGVAQHGAEAGRFALKAFKKNFGSSVSTGIIDSSSKAFVDSGQTQMVRKWSKAYLGNNAFGTAAEYIGKVTSLPFTMLGTMDEGFKQLAARSRAGGLLYQKGAALGLGGDELQAYIKNNSEKLFRSSGKIMDRDTLFKEGLEDAKKQGITSTRDALSHANEYQATHFDPELAGMKDELMKYTKKVTFQDDLTGISKAVSDAANKHQLALGWVLPFVKTPTNVLKYGFDEFMNVKDVARIFRSELTSADVAVKGEAQARFATAATVLGSALGFANMGVMTGSGPRDQQRRSALMATGWQPYSIKFGDTYISYNRMDPIATPLALVADMVDTYHSGKLDEADGDKLINAMMLSTTEAIKSKSYLQGIVTMMTMLDDVSNGRGTANAASRFVGSFVPAIVASGVQMMGKGNDAIVQTRSMFDGIQARTGFDDTLEIKRNLFGEELKRSDTQVAGISMFAPTVVSRKRHDKALQALVDSGVDMGAPSTKVDGVDLREIKMKDGRSAYSQYLDNIRDVRLGGRNSREAIKALVGSRRYQAAPNDQGADGEQSLRAQMIKSVLGKYRKAAKAKLYQQSKEFEVKATNRRDIRAQVRSGQSTVADAINRLIQNNY